MDRGATADSVGIPGKINVHNIMLQWTEEFSTGASHLDHQHRTLISKINHLEEVLAIAEPTREDCDFMVHLVNFLEHYADKHFTVEEQCMESFRCPSHAKNKQAHGQFMILIQDFKDQYQAKGFQRDLVIRLHETLGLWIMDHILKVDAKLKPCIKG